MPRRVTIVCEYATLNGGEWSLLAALDHLPRQAFRAAVLAPEGHLAEALRTRGIEHVPFSFRDGGRLAHEQVRERLLAAVRATRPDIVHANSLSVGRITGLLTERIDVPCLAHLRDIVGLSAAAVAALNRHAALLAVSRATRDYHVAQGLDTTRVRVVYNGVDCRLFRPRPASGWLRRALRLPDAALLVATIGQIGPRKGQDLLAKAAVRNAESLPHAHYLLVGERHSAKAETVAFERALAATFARGGIGERLHALGRRDDVDRLLDEIDVLVHPARQEPLGRVLLEAGAAGVPIIAADVGGTREVLQHETSALLVPPNDARALAEALRRLAGDGALRRRLGRAARGVVASRFEIRARAADLATLWSA